jgi:hypothetical protein
MVYTFNRPRLDKQFGERVCILGRTWQNAASEDILFSGDSYHGREK